ncbi:hypothetical protein CJF12_00160 [Chryseobacterium piperi]|uniref:hypothetical protein n=1 Tax=Chryseobacterium piperi TaxID=558152 RepID=UPI000BAA975F|nr:hypothetical protein [Chryseobacterium piperi]ASW72850.1 hypothetical protein CJF12_00105 [Chryseobacterium piperi]ASW72858.1 hypothetical protein CJF12_00160 [Chryseobacterium piperi]
MLNAQEIKLNDFKLIAYDIEAKNVSILSYSTLDKNGKLNVYLKRHKDTVFIPINLRMKKLKK